MAFEKMTSREQVLVMVVLGICVLGAYGLMRYVPQTKALGDLSKALEGNKAQIKNPKFPEEPDEDVDELQEKNMGVSSELEALLNAMETEEKKLVPVAENQDMLLKISEAARAAGVKVIESLPYIVQRKNGDVSAVNKQKVSKRVQRKIEKEARKRARKAGASTSVSGSSTQGAVPKEGELIYHLVNDFNEARPLQRISVEGSFKDLQTFLQAVGNMQYQATVVKLDINVKIQTPPQGMPQPLMARLIIAM